MALWKSTNQTSTYSESGISLTSNKAVDGNGDGNFKTGYTCTHTMVQQTHSPTWSVNLGKAYSIIAIKIANRNDNCKYAETSILINIYLPESAMIFFNSVVKTVIMTFHLQLQDHINFNLILSFYKDFVLSIKKF